MKLAYKLYIFVMLVLLIVVSLYGCFSYLRETRLFENNMKLDAHILGRAMSSALSEVRRVSGHARVLDMIERANKVESLIQLRWVWLEDGPDDAYQPQITPQELSLLAHGRDFSVRGKRKDGVPVLYTYIPVDTNDGRFDALELSQSLAVIREYTHTSVKRLAFMAGVLMAVGSLIIGAAGHWLVGRRMQDLVGHARNIADGDLSKQLEIQGNDELTELGIEMNSMCRRLKESRDKLVRETNARIETLEELRHTERLATLGRLSSGVAHELGTPLNVVSGRAKLIAAEDLTKEEIIESSKIIGEQVERMTKTIRQLLDFARRRAPEKSKVNIGCLVGQVLDMLNPMAKKQSVTLEPEIRADPVIIAVDSSQFQQVLMNLVMNGIQAMPNGGQLEVGLDLEHINPPGHDSGPIEECLALSVTDEGDGISEEHIDRIFEPFFTTKGAAKGTGLGLSIVYGIVQEHGGWIDVESELGKGARFTIYLPMEVGE